MKSAFASQAGATLVELVVSIVIVATAAAAVLGVLSLNVGASADPMQQHQAAAIAEAYLEEILLRPVDDPDGADGESSRADFDDVDDFDGLADSGARNQFGTPIAGLEAYGVSVQVTPSAALAGVPSSDALRVDVRVTESSGVDFTLSAYRVRL
ncbi:MAG: MSHA biogenesis protein MshD [Woeseiaceae bacterium]|nr:MSHA biogenesis protein MshD [Woeseiaceae bacterium]